jgi:D-lactate dehydrogenase (cytochrome)
VAELKSRLGSRVSTETAALEEHSRDESHHRPALPDAVVACTGIDDIVAALKTCHTHGVPVIPFGAGTGLEGGVIPIQGGITLDLAAMNRILRVGVEDLDVTVEAGVTLSQRGCSSRWTRAPTRPWAGWSPPAPAAPTRCATGR